MVPVEFEKDGLALSYLSTVTTLGTPQDAMLQETRIESFFPADAPTAAHAWTPPRDLTLETRENFTHPDRAAPPTTDAGSGA